MQGWASSFLLNDFLFHAPSVLMFIGDWGLGGIPSIPPSPHVSIIGPSLHPPKLSLSVAMRWGIILLKVVFWENKKWFSEKIKGDSSLRKNNLSHKPHINKPRRPKWSLSSKNEMFSIPVAWGIFWGGILSLSHLAEKWFCVKIIKSALVGT